MIHPFSSASTPTPSTWSGTTPSARCLATSMIPGQSRLGPLFPSRYPVHRPHRFPPQGKTLHLQPQVPGPLQPEIRRRPPQLHDLKREGHTWITKEVFDGYMNMHRARLRPLLRNLAGRPARRRRHRRPDRRLHHLRDDVPPRLQRLQSRLGPDPRPPEGPRLRLGRHQLRCHPPRQLRRRMGATVALRKNARGSPPDERQPRRRHPLPHPSHRTRTRPPPRPPHPQSRPHRPPDSDPQPLREPAPTDQPPPTPAAPAAAPAQPTIASTNA